MQTAMDRKKGLRCTLDVDEDNEGDDDDDDDDDHDVWLFRTGSKLSMYSHDRIDMTCWYCEVRPTWSVAPAYETTYENVLLGSVWEVR